MNEIQGKILVVDDQISWRELLSEILLLDGHLVSTAESYSQGLELLKNQKFDLAIIDKRLVDNASYNIQGIQLLGEAIKIQPSIKAIILTGYPDKEQKEKALDQYKATAYFEKAPNGQALDINKFSNQIFKLLRD